MPVIASYRSGRVGLDQQEIQGRPNDDLGLPKIFHNETENAPLDFVDIRLIDLKKPFDGDNWSRDEEKNCIPGRSSTSKIHLGLFPTSEATSVTLENFELLESCDLEIGLNFNDENELKFQRINSIGVRERRSLELTAHFSMLAEPKNVELIIRSIDGSELWNKFTLERVIVRLITGAA